MNGHDYFPTQLYLQKHEADWIWPVGYGLPAPVLNVSGKRQKRVKGDLTVLVLNHWKDEVAIN